MGKWSGVELSAGFELWSWKGDRSGSGRQAGIEAQERKLNAWEMFLNEESNLNKDLKTEVNAR